MKKPGILLIFAGLVGSYVAPGSASGGAAAQSIRHWVSCDGRSDDSAGAARAFAAARHGAFTLLVDCPARLHIGMDISHPIFIDDGTSVEFTAAGKFIVDNIFIPAFVIANSSHIALTHWNVEYEASLPASPKVGGYERNGRIAPGPLPPNAFNDLILTPWLAANRGLVFDRTQGNVNSRWSGATNLCAVFFFAGDVADVRVAGMHVYVAANAGGERFVPVVFSFNLDFKSRQTVTAQTPASAEYLAVPHDLTFSDITLDGTYMGWIGGVRDAVFHDIKSHRYGDWQDAAGGNVGGAGKWFAPPHLFYLSYAASGDPQLFNRSIRIDHVVDDGPRIGTARDKGGADSLSGYALSLKIGCVDCSVDHYRTTRPDGFIDVLAADGLTISNVDASYDSSFLNDVFPGWRFPSSPYRHLTFKNVRFEDTAPSSIRAPIGDATQASNEEIVFDHVQVTLNRWAGPQATPLPVILGQGNEISLDYLIREDSTRIVESQNGAASLMLRVRPSNLRSPGPIELAWSSKRASACLAGGAWNGAVGTAGERTVMLETPGSVDFKLECRGAGQGVGEGGGDSTGVSVPVSVAAP